MHKKWEGRSEYVRVYHCEIEDRYFKKTLHRIFNLQNITNQNQMPYQSMQKKELDKLKTKRKFEETQ